MVTRWNRLRVVEHMQEVIERHLRRPLTLAGLTRGTGYSMFHAARLFKEETGHTPFAYLRRRRLAAAATQLAAGEQRIVEVAFDFVFDSHEGFIRAFARQFGMTPSEYRRRRPELDLFLPPPAGDHYTLLREGKRAMQQEQEKVRTVFVQILERPARRLVLRRGTGARHYFEYCQEVGCRVWEQLGEIAEALHEPMGLWLPAAMRPAGTSEYVQGVEVPADWAGEVPQGFEVIPLPPCRLLVFQGPPFEESRFEEAIESLWAVMNEYQPERIGYRWADEDAPRFQLIPLGERGYIEGRPVRPLEE